MKVLLVIYDNNSYINWFPHGAAYVASYLISKGHSVEIYNQDIYHYPPEHLTHFLNENKFDVVGVGIIAGYYQYAQLLKISKAINNSINYPVFVLGGHGPSPEPKYFLEKTKADFVIIGEGELTFCGLLENLNTPDNVKGIAFLKNKKLVKTEKREEIKDMDSILFPAWHLFPINHYVLTRQPGFNSTDRLMPVLSGRGCPYKCNFCYRMMKGFRPRSSENIVKEIKYLKETYNVNAIDFSDELFMISTKRTITLCETFLREELNIKWSCNGRLNFADKEVLKLMKKAGCVFVNWGIESLDDQVLKNMNKNLTVAQIIKGVENARDLNMIQGLNIIFGNIGETLEILKKGVNFLKKYSKGTQFRTIRPVTPYPGSPLYYYAIEKGLLKDINDFYKKHINSDLLSVNFTDLSDEDFYKGLKEANLELIEDYYNKNKKICMNQAIDLYDNLNSDFRGFRSI